MLRFLLYAVVAYFLYQLIMAVDWGGAFSSATDKVNHTTNDAYQGVADSSIVQTIGDSFNALKNLILP